MTKLMIADDHAVMREGLNAGRCGAMSVVSVATGKA